MDSRRTIIEIENLSFSYGEMPVLIDVNLKIHEKESVCIIGPNGGGKSTLLNLILGLIKPQKGSIKVFGESPDKARGRIGYMPQYTQFDPAFPVTVMDIVLMGRVEKHLFGFYNKNDKKLALEALSETGMEALAKRHFSELSGGQRQRVLISRALVCAPELLLLDEPTANVDPAVQEQFYVTLERLNRKMAVIIVSHDLGVMSQKIESAVCVNRYVNIHPTSELDGTTIQKVYGANLRMIRHDHRCSGEGHCHE